ncbi:hypothetical protein ACFT8Q_00005, partial [Streptomyces griseoincarnatus]
MDAQDKGSDARHGPAEPGVPGPRAPLPGPAAPADEPSAAEPPSPDGKETAAAEQPPRDPADGPRTGVAALSLRYQIGAALALA